MVLMALDHVCAELVIVNFAWTFDITYSFRILQVIWAIGLSMIALSGISATHLDFRHRYPLCVWT